MSKVHYLHLFAIYLVILTAISVSIGLEGPTGKEPGAFTFEQIVTPKLPRLVITVGGPSAQIAGYSSEDIQIAVDAVKSRGGGVVKLNAGTFEVIAPIRLHSNVELVGSEGQTVLHKCNGFKTKLVRDCGFAKLEVVVEDVSGFKPGMGVLIYDSKKNGCWDPTTARIVDIKGNVLLIDRHTVQDYISTREGVVSNACSVVEVIEARDVRIADIVVDGNRQTNESISGCRGGGVYLHKVQRCLIENVTVRNFNGEGIDWQTTEDVTVRNCQAYNCSARGAHPGTGALRTIVEDCEFFANDKSGIYICWRVQNSIFRNNRIYGNAKDGISIGHKDTDNLFEGNHIYENGRHGIYFRKERDENASHRNRFVKNVIQDNGTKKEEDGGYGIFIQGPVRDLFVEGNTIADTGKDLQKGGVFISEDACRIQLKGNTISGHRIAPIVDESGQNVANKE